MIRICLFGNKAYGYDITGWEKTKDQIIMDTITFFLDEDLLERIDQGDILMYFDVNESAEDWCEEHGFEYELVEKDDNEE